MISHPPKSKTEKMSQKKSCSPLLTKEAEISYSTSLQDTSDHGLNENDSLIVTRRPGILGKTKKSNAATSDDIRRTKSEGREALRTGVLRRGGSERRSCKITRQPTEDLREVADFPVKPYYTDDSDQTVSIP